MTAFIEYKEGKFYDPAHLRPFDLALAKSGHPICTFSGRDVRLLREASKLWAYDEWHRGIGGDDGYWGTTTHAKQAWLTTNLRLAPLAIKDGRALHVGDEIEIDMGRDRWLTKDIEFPVDSRLISFISKDKWRFADEVAK